MDTVQRLEELLQLKDAELEKRDAEIEQRDEKIDRLERQLRFEVDWMLHERGNGENETLPVPRVQMMLTHEEERYQEYAVDMVLPNRDGSVTYVPVHYSKTSGGRMDVKDFPTVGELPDNFANALPGILNDACYLMEKTGLTAYVKLDPEHVYKVTSLRPLKLEAV